MMASQTFTFREWDEKSYGSGTDEIPAEVIRLLEVESNRLAAKPENSDKLRPFDFYLHEMRARNYVGVVAVGDFSVEILPKIQSDDDGSLAYLLALLDYTKKLRTSIGDETGLRERRGTFLEAWISYFARELNHLLRTNYKQRYVEIEERTTFLHGKLLTERDLDGSSNIYARYPCRYEIFTPDHLLNHTLKFCNKLLMKQTKSLQNRAVLRENDILLADVEDVPVLAKDLQKIHLNRLDREYEKILALCRLLLENSTLDLRAGRIKQLAILFDMNKLFEDFVAEFLERNKQSICIGGSPVERVEMKKNLGKLFDEFKMEVDVVLHTARGTYLLDTKYKVLKEESNHAGLSQSDFYQMYGYVRSRDVLYDGIILLYPKTNFSPGSREFENRDGARLFVRTVDVAECHDGRGNIQNKHLVEELNSVFRMSGNFNVRQEVSV